jgi:hypothetical protein
VIAAGADRILVQASLIIKRQYLELLVPLIAATTDAMSTMMTFTTMAGPLFATFGLFLFRDQWNLHSISSRNHTRMAIRLRYTIRHSPVRAKGSCALLSQSLLTLCFDNHSYGLVRNVDLTHTSQILTGSAKAAARRLSAT